MQLCVASHKYLQILQLHLYLSPSSLLSVERLVLLTTKGNFYRWLKFEISRNLILSNTFYLFLQGCINPLRLCLPAVFICSFSFMLPFTTPANAIAYEASGMKTLDMIKVGWIMNITMTLITIGCTNTYGVLLFDLSRYPGWAMTGMNDTCLYNNATSQ